MTTTFTISLDPEEAELAQRAADAAGLSLPRWMQTVLLGAAAGEPDELGEMLDCVTVGRDDIKPASRLREAQQWIGEGFSVQDVRGWLDTGCRNPMQAAFLRDAGVAPQALEAVWKGSFERAGTALSLGGGLSQGYLAVSEVLEALRM